MKVSEKNLNKIHNEKNSIDNNNSDNVVIYKL